MTRYRMFLVELLKESENIFNVTALNHIFISNQKIMNIINCIFSCHHVKKKGTNIKKELTFICLCVCVCVHWTE